MEYPYFNLVRFAHNWSRQGVIGIVECWNNGLWDNEKLGETPFNTEVENA